MAMAKRSIDNGKIANGKSSRSSKGGANSPNRVVGEAPHTQRLSPVGKGAQQSPPSSPRTSPGLLAGHYAGCKFSEPPLPSALPLPPQHWMQASCMHRHARLMPFHHANNDHLDIAQQLKVLLKVQA